MMSQKNWFWVAGLAAGGVIDSAYLLLYQLGRIRRLVCPIFGSGCEKVAGSQIAFPAGIPDAIFGVAGYTAAGITAAAIPKTSGETKKTLAKLVIGGSIVAVGVSAYLTYAQRTKTHAWCFWCLTSAAISTAIASLAIPSARNILQEKQP
jgi:uncharacterized membrane protein